MAFVHRQSGKERTRHFSAYVDAVLSYGTERRLLSSQASYGTMTPLDTWMPRPWLAAIQLWLNVEGT